MAEKAPELYFDEAAVTKPDIYLVPPVVEHDVLVNVVIDVDGEERPLRINVSRGTLGNGQTIHSYFERFENVRVDNEGHLVGDFGRADLLASVALRRAEHQAGVNESV